MSKWKRGKAKSQPWCPLIPSYPINLINLINLITLLSSDPAGQTVDILRAGNQNFGFNRACLQISLAVIRSMSLCRFIGTAISPLVYMEWFAPSRSIEKPFASGCCVAFHDTSLYHDSVHGWHFAGYTSPRPFPPRAELVGPERRESAKR